MAYSKSAEQHLYSDLTRLLTKLRNEPLATVESVIEERFRAYIRAGGTNGNKLQITLTWALPEGAESWPLYGTEYGVTEAETLIPAIEDVTVDGLETDPEIENRDNVLAFVPNKAASRDRSVARQTSHQDAVIFPFPLENAFVRQQA
jgi:hypothetical protein